MIEIKNLTYGYSHGKEIFNDINFSLNKGDKIGLVGPNGTGKTTLFHLIMGLLKPTSGEITVFGNPRENEKDFREVRERIGLVFQDSEDQLFCPTVEEDIAFGPLNLGKSHKEARRIVTETCERLGLEGYEKKIIHRLSGGEKRLVALAAVMAMSPECLLLDEPTAGLDDVATGKLLHSLKENADTFIIISHDHEFLKNAVDKLYKVDKGKVNPV